MADAMISEAPASVSASRRMRPSLPRRPVAVWTARVLVLAAFIWAWQQAADQGWIPIQFVSRPSDVAQALGDLYRSGELMTQTVATLQAVLIAMVLGIPLGIAIGLLLAALPALDDVVGPYLVPLNSLPRIALAPLFILWFGLTLQAKVALSVSIIAFILIFNTRSAIKSVDPDLVTVARLLGLRRHQVFQKIVLPASVPPIFAAVRLSITYALLGVIASEMIASRDGLGQTLVFFAGRLQIGGVFAVLLVLAVIATLLAVILERLEGWLLRWQ